MGTARRRFCPRVRARVSANFKQNAGFLGWAKSAFTRVCARYGRLAQWSNKQMVYRGAWARRHDSSLHTPALCQAPLPTLLPNNRSRSLHDVIWRRINFLDHA